MPAAAAIDAPVPPGRAEGWHDLLAGGRAPVLALLALGCWVAAADSLVTATIMPAVDAALAGIAAVRLARARPAGSRAAA